MASRLITKMSVPALSVVPTYGKSIPFIMTPASGRPLRSLTDNAYLNCAKAEQRKRMLKVKRKNNFRINSKFICWNYRDI